MAAYSLFIRAEVIRTDLLYFVTLLGTVSAFYTAAVLATGQAYSFRLLETLALILVLAILSHGLVDLARRGWDRLFLAEDVQIFRQHLAAETQSAALVNDLGPLLDRSHAALDEVSQKNLVRLTEDALRWLNKPSALARCELTARLPSTLTTDRARRGDGHLFEATPLEQAQALREVLTTAIERLKPVAHDVAPGSVGALQYDILRDEYLLGRPTRQMMMRHSISEATFHRNRREAISILAYDLSKQEDLLSRVKVESV